MSGMALIWAANVKGLKPAAKIVLIQLADFHNKETGQCNPSAQRLADECEMGRATLFRHMTTLEECALITRHARGDGDGGRGSNQYELHLDITGPCEGRQASPSNPTGAGKARTKEPLTETFVFRCTAAEKGQLRAKAEAAGLSAATLLREALGLTEARRRKPIPRVDPTLVLAVGRIGGNLNQIARWLNHAMKVGRTDLDALTVARRLLTIERQLAQIVEASRRC